jgi:RNA polymerase sigma factor (sigma-70 family)
MAHSGERWRATNNRAIGSGSRSVTPAAPPRVNEQLEQLFRDHAERLERFARTKVGPQASEDIVQESFTLLGYAMTKGMRIDNPPGYLVGIAKGVIAEHHAKQAAYRALFMALSEQLDGTIRVQDHGQDHTDDIAQRLDLDRAKKQHLTARQRQMEFLRYEDDLTEPDIAALLRVTRGAVSATLNQTRVRLRPQLPGYGPQEGRRECP